MPDRRRSVRRNDNLRLLVAALVAVALLGGLLAVRSITRVTLTGRVAPGKVASAVGPHLSVPKEITPSVPGRVMTLRGLVDGAVSLTANGDPVELDRGGGFAVHLPQEWKRVRLVATDRAGAKNRMVVAIRPNPSRANPPVVRAVHVTIEGWATPAVHDEIVAMAQAGLINAVELDIKDDDGEVGYESKVALANEAGAVRTYYDAREATDELHALDVRVIGRIVNFFDPVLAKWAWNNGERDMIVLDGGGDAPLANDYGTAVFTNFANRRVRQYQIDLAREAVKLGFDEILYDYVRRPEGDLSTMTFPGLEMPPDVSIARFVGETKTALQGTDALLGVSVFGVSAAAPQDTAQDVGLLAPLVDYISPMVYPALWGSGQYGVESPVEQPAEIISASLTDFERLAAGSGAAVRPWLQDFSSRGVPYGPDEVRAQIDAAAATGADGFILWNVKSLYHADALDTN
jgi:hypothetical protein